MEVSRRQLLRSSAAAAASGLVGSSVVAADPCGETNTWRKTGVLESGGMATYTYVPAFEESCGAAVWLDGPEDADADLYLTLDGREPSADDYDRKSNLPGAEERVELDGTVMNSVPEVRIGVDFYEESGRYEVGVEETGSDRTSGTAGTERLSASATTLSFIPGLSEDETADGDDLHSAMPSEKAGVVPVVPFDDIPADTGFVGDHRREMPDSLSDALALEKHVEGVDRTFHPYRFRNSLNVAFATEDGRTVDVESGVEVRVNGDGDLGDRYGERTPDELPLRTDGEKRFVVEEFETGPTYTILEEDVYRNLQAGPIEAVDGQRYRPVHRVNRYLSLNREEFTRDGETVEGVRASTVWGASNPYTHQIASMDDFPVVDDFTPDNPILYTWVELTVLADGTRLVRVPDASVYPRHAGYLGDTKRATNGLDVIYEEDTDSGGGYDVAIDEKSNNVWDRFKTEFDENRYVPYGSDHDGFLGDWFSDSNDEHEYYLEHYRDDGWAHSTHPVMAFGETPEGGSLGRSGTLSILDREPLAPFPDV